MKTRYLLRYVRMIALAMLLLQSCQKGERFETSTPQIVELTFSGSTSVPLEFIYDNNIVDTTIGQNNCMPNPFTLNIAKGDQTIHVREKGEIGISEKLYDQCIHLPAQVRDIVR